jgi:hypothetical protein
MSSLRHVLSACALTVVLLAGCASPRFVQVDGQGGIVALPENSNVWPTYHRDKAEAMISKRCRNGYVIVREEEVATGSVAHTNSQTDTREAPALLLGGANGTSEKTGKNGERHSSTFGGVAIPIGEQQRLTRQTTTVRDVTEWRIYYQSK